jgi:GNAT superfamily N-acetyltransferase
MFATDTHTVRALERAELPALQALFEANADYFEFANGVPVAPDAAAVEFDERPPPQLPYTRHWVAGLFGAGGRLDGALVVAADLGTAGVWHLALLLVDHAQRGRGLAAASVAALERWARAEGARWLRLVVLEGNTRAERFWAAQGFESTRTRTITDASGRPRVAQVRVKPLAGGTLADYRRLVPRDDPQSDLP